MNRDDRRGGRKRSQSVFPKTLRVLSSSAFIVVVKSFVFFVVDGVEC
jgi:hypothetical protein